MRSELFSGSNLRDVFDHARAALGEDVVILRTDVSRRDGASTFQVVAAPADEVEGLRRRLDGPAQGRRRGPFGRGDIGPLVVALVGPTGVGKTTTVAKLALAAAGFRRQTVGVLTLDTFRVGALEQISELTGLADLALEVAYEPADVPRALARLDRCDVVVVDTPGRSPRSERINAKWRAMLQAASPDEVHLMIPAALRPSLLAPLCAEYASCHPTHALFAKADELGDDDLLLELTGLAELPVRWVTSGQDVRQDLEIAHGRVLSALSGRATSRPVAA